jgi:hypothetical protein
LILSFVAYLLLFFSTISINSLAEMCVHQTRAFILERDGYIVDNPNVGPTLANAYWKFGNEKMFLDLVQQLTGKPLSGDAWVAVLEKGTEVLLKEEREDYEKSLKEVETKVKDGSKNDDDEEEINLNMTIRFVDGDVLISDSSKDSVLKACQEFELYVLNRIGN